MFRAVLVIQSSRGGIFKRSAESQSYEQSNCHVDGLRGDLPSDFSVQLGVGLRSRCFCLRGEH